MKLVMATFVGCIDLQTLVSVLADRQGEVLCVDTLHVSLTLLTFPLHCTSLLSNSLCIPSIQLTLATRGMKVLKEKSAVGRGKYRAPSSAPSIGPASVDSVHLMQHSTNNLEKLVCHSLTQEIPRL
jgi:hypothetical protein